MIQVGIRDCLVGSAAAAGRVGTWHLTAFRPHLSALYLASALSNACKTIRVNTQ